MGAQLTLVLKIDFGGVCSVGHPCKPLIDALGICQIWIDRMLRTVTVLKNSLENQCQVGAQRSPELSHHSTRIQE